MTAFKRNQMCFAAMLLLCLFAVFSGCSDPSPSPVSSDPVSPATVDAPLPGPESSAETTAGSESCPIHFMSVGAEAGIDFVHLSGDSEIKPFPAANGSGVGAVDYDCDGLCDLYFATGNTISERAIEHPARNRLFRNGGGLRFTDTTANSETGHRGFSAGIAIGDYNSDGFPDVYVVCFGPNRLYCNQGDGTFLDVSENAGMDDPRWGTSAVFLDYDADGLLDVYSGNYGHWSLETNIFCGDRENGLRMFCSPTTVPPERDGLFRNDGMGHFSDVISTAGPGETASRTQGVLAADLNGDSYTDLYLGNDLNPNSLLINEAGNSFRDQAEMSGTAYDRSGVAQAGMGVTTADVDRDGLFDLFVTNFENEHNAFYRQDAAGFFQDTSHLRGLAAAGMPFIGWGTMFADFDLDGWHDAIVINGHTDNNLHELGREGDYEQRPLLWHNDHGRFEAVSSCAGNYFQSVHPGRGLAIADLDNDLDWDVICCHQDAAPVVLANNSKRIADVPAVIELRLIGRYCNRDAIGCVAEIRDGERKILEQITGGGSYLSSSQRRIVIPVSERVGTQATLQVTWTGGRVTEIAGLRPGGRYTLVEPRNDDLQGQPILLPDEGLGRLSP